MYVDPKKVGDEGIVIYDADLQWRQILTRELHVAGFAHVTQTATAKEALQTIRDSAAGAIITQHDLDLIAFLRTHKASPNRDIVIILVTAELAAADIIAGRDSGVTEIVAKPASVDQVIKHLYEALTHPRRFIDAKSYHGPDRRRHLRDYDKPERRGGGKAAVSDDT